MCTEKKRFEKKGKNTFNLLALGVCDLSLKTFNEIFQQTVKQEATRKAKSMYNIPTFEYIIYTEYHIYQYIEYGI